MNIQRNQYLRDVETRLQRLPQVDREQEMAEITQHLDSLIATGQSDGQTETAATAAAIVQFGTAREIGGALTQAGANRRFTSVGETLLFCTPVAALLSFVWFVFLCSQGIYYWGFDSYSDTPTISVLRHLFANYGAYFTVWFAGLAASSILSARYGIRGALRKSLNPASPVDGAVRWMLLSFLLGKIAPLLICRTVVVPTEFSLFNAYGSAQLFYAVVWLLIPWASAYMVGRTSRARESIVGSVGLASLLDTLFMLLTLVFWLLRYQAVYQHKPFSTALYSFAIYFGSSAFWGIVNLCITRFFARWGEKSRSHRFSQKKGSNYEPAF